MPLSLESLCQIDQICVKFEDCWLQGETPLLELFWAEAVGVSVCVPEGATSNSPEAIDDSVECELGQQLLNELLKIDLVYREKRSLALRFEEYLQLFPKFRAKIEELAPATRPVVVTPHRYAAGDRIGRYRIEYSLGKGAFGAVYLATDEELGRKVAIKYPADHQLNNQEVVSRLFDEARLAAKLDHKGIVRVYDVFRDDHEMPAIVMQFIRGKSLRERMNSGPIPKEAAVSLVTEIASAIDYAHQAGVYHRDLEPRNILLDEEERPYVTDFGLAIHESVQGIAAGESAGSLAYMAPEQVCGRSNWLDGRADIWALGVVLYELLTGRRPFSGTNLEDLSNEIMVRDPKPPRQIVRGISKELESICLRCLNKDIVERFPTAGDLADALKNTVETSSGQQRNRWMGKTALIVGTFAAAILVMLFAPLLWSNRQQPAYTTIAPAPAATKDEATVEDIQITVWNQDNKFRGNIGRFFTQGAPLRTGDMIRVEVLLSQPMHACVCWIGCDGDVTPVFPGQPGVWEKDSLSTPVKRIGLPAAADQLWPVRAGNRGVEAIVVLVSDGPFPLDCDLEAVLSDVAPQVTELHVPVLWFENGHSILQKKERSIDVHESSRVTDSVYRNQTQIAEKLTKHNIRAYSLAFPIEK